MKDERNKRIRILAQKIVKLEKELQSGKNIEENQTKIENIMNSLSFTDLLEVESYISRKKLLTK